MLGLTTSAAGSHMAGLFKSAFVEVNYLASAKKYNVYGSSVTAAGATSATGGSATATAAITGVPFGNPQDYGNAAAAQCSTDAQNAYAYFKALPGYGDAYTVAGGARIATSPVVSGDLGGVRFTPGVYSAAAATSNSNFITIDAMNNPNAIFVFQLGAAFTPAASTGFILLNGAKASMIYFAVTGAVAMGASADFQGTIMSPAALGMGAGATLTGRLLTWSGAVTLSANTLILPV
jgi:hypothetical protein